MGPAPAARGPADTFARILFDKRTMTQIAAALPKHMSADRMARITLTEVRKNPDLQKCDPLSVIAALIQCSQLGLEPGNGMGHAYLIPYGRECQMIVGYRGLIDLIIRTGQVKRLVARVVHEGDDFEYAYGLEERLDHVPSQLKAPGPMTHVYAVAYFKDGTTHFEVMTRAEVEAIRDRKKGAAERGPWRTDFDEMAKKTAIRRIAKHLPQSPELQAALAVDSGQPGVDTSLLLETHHVSSGETVDAEASHQPPPALS